jgi:hypothetical protein
MVTAVPMPSCRRLALRHFRTSHTSFITVIQIIPLIDVVQTPVASVVVLPMFLPMFPVMGHWRRLYQRFMVHNFQTINDILIWQYISDLCIQNFLLVCYILFLTAHYSKRFFCPSFWKFR